jgi:TatD DNase family protein
VVLYDSHTHLDDERFDDDREEVIQRAFDQGIYGFINIGCDMSSSERSVALAQQYPTIYAAVGVHPHEAESVIEADYEQLALWTAQAKVVAIGEIGLDYYYDNSPRLVQQQVFIRQLAVARQTNMPVIIHARDAQGDLMRILRNEGRGLTGIIHCYSGSLETARELVAQGFYLGIGGSLTFTNAKKLKQIVTELPIAAFVVETDCPYLTPTPYRGRRNEPAYVGLVAQEIAALKQSTVEQVAEVTTKNLQDLFGLSSVCLNKQENV